MGIGSFSVNYPAQETNAIGIQMPLFLVNFSKLSSTKKSLLAEIHPECSGRESRHCRWVGNHARQNQSFSLTHTHSHHLLPPHPCGHWRSRAKSDRSADQGQGHVQKGLCLVKASERNTEPGELRDVSQLCWAFAPHIGAVRVWDSPLSYNSCRWPPGSVRTCHSDSVLLRWNSSISVLVKLSKYSKGIIFNPWIPAVHLVNSIAIPRMGNQLGSRIRNVKILAQTSNWF